jgi:hypothetical protein
MKQYLMQAIISLNFLPDWQRAFTEFACMLADMFLHAKWLSTKKLKTRDIHNEEVSYSRRPCGRRLS